VFQEDIGEHFNELAGGILLFADVVRVLDIISAFIRAFAADRSDIVLFSV